MSGTGAGVAAILLASLIWGTTGTAATFAPAVGAAAIGAAAMGIGGLLQALLAVRGIVAARAALRAQTGLLLAGGVAVAVYPLAFYGSMRLAGVTIGTVITIGSAPLVSALIERLLDGTRLSGRWMAGAAAGLAGLILLSASGAHGDTGGTALLPGVALGLIGGATYAFYSWSARRLMLGGLPARTAMGATFGLGGLLLLPVLLATGAPFLQSWGNAAVGLYMALVPMLLGYIAFGYGLARVPASTATTLTLTEPVVAALLAAIVVGERLTPLAWAGIGLILCALAILTLRRRA